jgi:hypothetical protein
MEEALILIWGTSPGNGRPAKVTMPERPLKACGGPLIVTLSET